MSFKRKCKYSYSEYKKLHTIFSSMKQRCYNFKSPAFKYYGGRGIKICNDWLENIDAFIEWSLNNGYSEHLSIDRINVNGNYEPNNCRWTDSKTQSRNKRDNIFLEYHGKKQILQDWCDELGLEYEAIRKRLIRGWSIERAFATPINKWDESYTAECKKKGLDPTTVRSRIVKLGWSYDKAFSEPTNIKNRNTKAKSFSPFISEA